MRHSPSMCKLYINRYRGNMETERKSKVQEEKTAEKKGQQTGEPDGIPKKIWTVYEKAFFHLPRRRTADLPEARRSS